jgi:ubiquinone/menaquinone biosynthesis C-methylase UbiE
MQARLIDPMMRHTLRAAGIVPGMRVLDVGSGAGHVAFLAADIVGETGEVVGVDRSPAAIATARASAEARSLQNVSLQEGDPTLMAFERLFDAVIGRNVLMFQPDPTAMLRKLAVHVRPGARSSSTKSTGTGSGHFRRCQPVTGAAGGSFRRSALTAPRPGWE